MRTSAHQIGDRGRRGHRLHATPQRQTGQAGSTTQQRDGVVSDRDALRVDQFGLNPAGAVGAVRGLVNDGDPIGQPDVANCSSWRCSNLPLVVTRPRHRQFAARTLHVGALIGQLGDELERAFWGTTFSTAAAAFRKILTLSLERTDAALRGGHLGRLACRRSGLEAAVDRVARFQP